MPAGVKREKIKEENMKKKIMLLGIIALVLSFALLTGCGGSSPAGTPTVTKNVTVNFPDFIVSSTSINLAPASWSPQGGWDEHFPNTIPNDITYTVTVIGPEVNRTYNEGTGFTVAISHGFVSGTYTFTQTFELGGKVVGTNLFTITTAGGGTLFGSLSGSINSVLTLSKSL